VSLLAGIFAETAIFEKILQNICRYQIWDLEFW